ncbi:hypothetical protein J6590_043072 [Homalodisca vitripennis]|nr:hypothetical protein J6590_043072 [Homalodisca vitripennis]
MSQTCQCPDQPNIRESPYDGVYSAVTSGPKKGAHLLVSEVEARSQCETHQGQVIESSLNYRGV